VERALQPFAKLAAKPVEQVVEPPSFRPLYFKEYAEFDRIR